MELYRIEMNKSDDQSSSFTFNDNFSLNGSTSGEGVAKALEIENGTFILNNSSIDIDLSTGDDAFEIPSTGALEVQAGNVNISGASGIYLDGLLNVAGGTVNMADDENYIEYSASGSAAIEVTDGTLTVGAQIRRPMSTDAGILSYTQSGGTVIVGQYSAPEGTRGVLEIFGTGSSFEQTGGTLQIANGQDNASMAALYLAPETYTLGDGTTITLDPVQTSGVESIGIYSTIPLKNILLADDSNLNVKLWTVGLELEEDLEIMSGATFNANGMDVSIDGDFTNAGTFTHSNNTTIFTGVAAQTITGNTTFYNLTKEGTGDLSLNSGDTEISVANVLDIAEGTVVDNSNNIYVQGDFNFDGTHTYGGSGKGFVMNGEEAQNLSGNGTFGMLTINNAEGVDIELGNVFTINNTLRLESGVFNIGKNLLLLTEDGIIEHGDDDFSATNMIQTNTSFTDNGVQKTFPQMSSGSYEFTYPMGSNGKYTPATITVNANDNNTGTIVVKPADEYHPSVIDETDVLQYYWDVDADGISGLTGKIVFQYQPDDVALNADSAYTIDDYITACLLDDSDGEWSKYDNSYVDGDNNELTFNFSGNDDSGVRGDYTAGVDNAIPDEVISYITISDGDWDDEAIWATYSDGIITSGGPSGGPRGAIVYIADSVYVP
jgi:hypothetical protein